MEYDPVCGKRIEQGQQNLSLEHKKKRYYFCSERCKQAFEREMERTRLHELAKVGALMSKGRVRWGLA